MLKIIKPPGGLNREITVDGSMKTDVASAILSSQKVLYDHSMKNVLKSNFRIPVRWTKDWKEKCEGIILLPERKHALYTFHP